MNRPNFEIERHDQVLDGLGGKPLEPLPEFPAFCSESGGASLISLVDKMSAAATGARRKPILAPLQDCVEIPVFEKTHRTPPRR
jgi:hypothetical protein